jgi:hypothetical protein
MIGISSILIEPICTEHLSSGSPDLKSRIDSNHLSVAENDHLMVVLPFVLHHSLIGQLKSFH